MPSFQAKLNKLRVAALKELPDLYSAELSLLNISMIIPRETFDLSPTAHERTMGNREFLPAPDEVNPKSLHWSKKRHIRAGFIRWLCADEYASKLIDPMGIIVIGAQMIGELNLSYVNVPFPLQFINCLFSDFISLTEVKIPALAFTGCRTVGIDAASAEVKTFFSLDEGFYCEGSVNLRLARVGGDLNCSGGAFLNGPVIDPTTGKWDDTTGTAIYAEDISVEGSIFFRKEIYSKRRFRSFGLVTILAAHVNGDLDCSNGLFDNSPEVGDRFGNGIALLADRAVIKGTFFMNSGFQAYGEVSIDGVEIEGDLNCERGQFHNFAQPGRSQSGTAISGEGLIAKGYVFMRFGFQAEGIVSLLDSQIGTFDGTGGRFENLVLASDIDDSSALLLDRSVIKGEVRLTNERGQAFYLDGLFSMEDAQVTGSIVFDNSNISNGSLDLSGTTCRAYSDAGTGTWPKPMHLNVDDFRYEMIYPHGAEQRLTWLSLEKEFNNSSYSQLAKVLRQIGDDEGAQLVLRKASELDIRKRNSRWYLRPDYEFSRSIGYGYRPIMALWYSAAMTALGWIIYRRSYIAGTIAPTDNDAYEQMKLNGRPPENYPRFAPFIFSLENSLPLVKLGQSDKWQPNTATDSSLEEGETIPSIRENTKPSHGPTQEALALPTEHLERSNLHEDEHMAPLFKLFRPVIENTLNAWGLTGEIKADNHRRGTSPRFLRWFLWTQILLGWLFATLFIAGISGIIRKE